MSSSARPAPGKTTALSNRGYISRLTCPTICKGVGGTRNCDWFFTEEAVLVDTAGRYVQQESDPEVDAAEWQGFLELLHEASGAARAEWRDPDPVGRGACRRRNALRAHGREIRKRLLELRKNLA